MRPFADDNKKRTPSKTSTKIDDEMFYVPYVYDGEWYRPFFWFIPSSEDCV